MLHKGFSKEFIEETRMLFGPFSPDYLTDEDCIVLAQNMILLEIYLRELQNKYEKASVSSN